MVISLERCADLHMAQQTPLPLTVSCFSKIQIGISWAIWKSALRSRQITTPAPHHSVSYRPDALPAGQPNSAKAPVIHIYFIYILATITAAAVAKT